MEEVDVAAEPHVRPDPVGEEDLLLEEAARAALVDREPVHGEEAVALDLAVEGDVDLIVARLDLEPALGREGAERPEAGVACTGAVEVALVVLLDAVARDVVEARSEAAAEVGRGAGGALVRACGVAEEAQARVLVEREVAEERELVAAGVELEPRLLRCARAVRVAQVQVLAVGAPALRRVDRAEAVEASGRYLAQRDLPRAAPAPLVQPYRGRERGCGREIERVFPERVVAVVVLRVIEGTVRVVGLRGQRGLPLAEVWGGAGRVALRAEGAALGEEEVLLELVARDEVERAGGREVAELREERPLVEVQAVDGLRDQEVQVRVALAVRVRRQVHRQVVDEHGEVGAVIGVEAAHEVLRRLAAPLVLGDDHARQVVQDLLRGGVRAELVVACPDLLRRRRRERLPRLDDDLFEARLTLIVVCPCHDGEGHHRRGEDTPARRHDSPPDLRSRSAAYQDAARPS